MVNNIPENNIFVSTSCLKGRTGRFEKDVLYILSVYDRLGLKNIELGAPHSFVIDFSSLFIYQKKHDANFILHCNFPPIKEDIMLNIASADSHIHKLSMDAAKNSIELCRKLNSQMFSINGGFLGDFTTDMRRIGAASGYKEHMGICVESIQKILDMASEYGIRLAVENHHMRDPILFTTIDEFKELFKSIQDKNLGALIDLGHLRMNAQQYGTDEKQFIDAIKDRIFELHIHQVIDGKDHNMLADASPLDIIPDEVLRKAALTLEANLLSPNDILQGIKIIESKVK